QAEDGIRDPLVTGVQTCALPILFIIGARYFSLFIGILASLVLAMSPHFLGYSQYVSTENFISLFFTACTFSYYLYLEKKSTWLRSEEHTSELQSRVDLVFRLLLE